MLTCSELTCFEFEGDVVLVHQVVELAERAEEGVDALDRDVEERVSRLVAVVRAHHLPVQVQPAGDMWGT